MISLKIHRRGTDVLLAACDQELLGKHFREGEMGIKVHSEFYGGEVVEDEAFLTSMMASTIVNLVGERVVALAIKAGIADPGSIIRIEGVPHVQIMVLV